MERGFAKIIKLGFFYFISILAISAGISFEVKADDTVKIGITDVLSGAFEYLTRSYLAGVQFAADEQNEKGGLLGKKIEILVEDSELKPDVAVRKARKLILENKVDFLAPGSGTQNALAVMKVATEHKKIVILYTGISNFIMGKEFSRYAFRTCNNNYNITSATTKFMATKPYRKYYVVCQDYAYGHEIAEEFKEQLKINVPNAEIVGEDFHPIGTKDFAPYITKIIASKADVVFSGNWGPDATLLVKQARSLGLKVPFPFVMPISANDSYFINSLKDDAVGIIFCWDYDMSVKMPDNEAMLARYHAKHKNDKDFLTWWPGMFGYQTIMGFGMTFAAIEKAKSLDPEKIIEAFEGFQYKSPVGWTEMRKCDHQIILPMFAGVVKPGWNPWYNGSINPDIKLPWMGDVVTFPGKEVAIPPKPDYNPRCK